MNKKLFRKVEATLYNYKNMDAKIQNLEIDIENLKKTYQGVSPIQYGEKVQGTNKFSSIVESEVVHKERLIAKLEEQRDDVVSLKSKVENALKTLDAESKKLVELRYLGKKNTWTAIGIKMNLDSSYCCKRRTLIIERLGELIYHF